MASISGSGIGSAAPTAAWGASIRLLAPLLLALAGTAPPGSARLELRITNLRNRDGLIQICVTRDPAHFPDCTGDRTARHGTVPATTETIVIDGLAPGRYAVAAVHDENGNGRLDTFIGMPREGFAFSRDAPVRFGPPSFDDAVVQLAPGTARVTIRMRYLL